MLKTGVRPKERCPDFTFIYMYDVMYCIVPLFTVTYFIIILNEFLIFPLSRLSKIPKDLRFFYYSYHFFPMLFTMSSVGSAMVISQYQPHFMRGTAVEEAVVDAGAVAEEFGRASRGVDALHQGDD